MKPMRVPVILGLIFLTMFFAGCKGTKAPDQTRGKGAESMGITITSAVFNEGGPIPKKYTCDGDDVSPPLTWNGAPQGTKSLALICDDPDAPMGTWVHWVMWGLPAGTASLPEGVEKAATAAVGAKQGMNSWPKVGFNGPCPPPGKPHRYYFKLYALDTDLDLPANANKAALERAMKDHVLAQGQTMGTYGRQQG
jgi:Raf kinase inhibitor-like YbhB/YbcL family protein